MSEYVIASAVDLAALFPKWAMSDTRAGYSGYMVAKEHLLDVAAALKNEHGFDYLSSVTGVDYIATDKLEAAYQFYRSIGGPGVMVKVQTDRSNPEIPSLTGLYPGANLQEREVWDLVGIKFTNHPDLRRILTWEGFAGHPLQKDWHEPYFEEDVKPYKSRWPEGHVYRIEDKNPFGDNLQYPAGFDPEQFSPDFDQSLYTSLEKVEKTSADLATDQMVINFGPQHPSTHGVFRMVAILDGETIVDIKPVMGYLHRNHEKLGERNTYLQNMPFTDRLDYVCSMTNNFAYATTVEKLLGIKPPERAEYIRVMMAELTRFMNHMFSIGFILNDLGAMFTPNLYALEERELILDVFEAVSGSRMMCNYFRFGGVVRDLPEGMLDHVKKLVYDRLPRKLEEFDNYLTENEIVKVRCQGVGVLTSDQAIANSATGPTLRASGVPYDIRRAEPYSIYDRLDFDVCVRYHGDIYDRYLIRLDEMRQSLRILQQVVRDIPEGPIMTGKSQYVMKVPAGEVYSRTESPKGELGFYIVSDGTANPYRYHVRAPTFINLTSLSDMCKNGKIADVVTVVGSIDITLAEVDR